MQPFKVLQERKIFSGRYDVFEIDLETPGGKQVTWSFVAGKDIVVVLALDAENNVYLKQEWRQNRKDFVWEVASGLVPEENPTEEQLQEHAQRELQEEIGMKAGSLQKVLTMYPFNHMRAKIHLYLATDLTESKLQGDENEFLEVRKMPFQEAYDLVINKQEPTAQNAVLFLIVKNIMNNKRKNPA